jgi:catechol 2,3-dioxygenase-like lactoylglutathione lyase family enzyme
MDRSIAFYTEVMRFTLRKRVRIDDTGGEIAELLAHPSDEHYLELNAYPPDSAHGEPYARGSELDHLCLEVDDVDGEVDRLRALGVRIAAEPHTQGRYRLAYIEDPDGVTWELSSPPL